MQSKKIYTLNETKIAKAYYEGFIQKGSVLHSTENGGDGRHFIILNRFCSYEQGTKWGRFHCKSELLPNSTLKIYALSSDAEPEQAEELNAYFHDSDVPWSQKLACFMQNGDPFVNHQDILLYNMEGNYLWIAIEIESGLNDGIKGEINGVNKLYDMRLDTQGDNFLWTFPEIYQEEGGFFHRYLSIFSSVYQNLSDHIANLDRYLDLDMTPVPILTEIAEWLGFESEGDFLDERMLRSLVRKLYQLNRIKGTKEVISRLIDIVLGEEGLNNHLIIERNRLEGTIPSDVNRTYQKLYGTAMQEVTILVRHHTDEKLHSQLLYLIKQFKPARSHVRLVFCQKSSNLDSYCFLDFNAALSRKGYAYMDKNSRMSGTVVLQ